MERVAGGDRAAFRAFYDRTSGVLFSICMKLLRDRTCAEDILQDSFVRIWEKAGTFDPSKGNALTWAIVVARRMAIDGLRSMTRTFVEIDDEGSGIEHLAADLAEGDPIGKARLMPCLGMLKEPQRKALLMAYIYGHTCDEIAARFDRPAGTIKSWLFRGLADLRKCLE